MGRLDQGGHCRCCHGGDQDSGAPPSPCAATPCQEEEGLALAGPPSDPADAQHANSCARAPFRQLSQALSLRALQETPGLGNAPRPHSPTLPHLSYGVPPRPASAPPQKRTPRRPASYESNLSSLDERGRYWSVEAHEPADGDAANSARTDASRTSSDRQFEV